MDSQKTTAIVTGAGGGIGKLLTRQLLEEGCRVIAVDRDVKFITDLVLDYGSKRIIPFECDFTNSQEVVNLCFKILKKVESVDYLFNVAGIGVYKNLDDLKLSEWENTMAVNVNAPFILTKHLMPLLKKGKNSMVFNVGSGMGVYPSKGRSAYCTSKFALRGLSLSLKKEFENDGVDICLFTLGSVMTGFGTGGLKIRKKLEKGGKKYLNPHHVVSKIIEITKNKKRNAEYELYPEGYP